MHHWRSYSLNEAQRNFKVLDRHGISTRSQRGPDSLLSRTPYPPRAIGLQHDHGCRTHSHSVLESESLKCGSHDTARRLSTLSRTRDVDLNDLETTQERRVQLCNRIGSGDVGDQTRIELDIEADVGDST